VVIECQLQREDGGTQTLHVLDMDFFDEQNVVIVFEPCRNEGL
jgi:hypothetical protein